MKKLPLAAGALVLLAGCGGHAGNTTAKPSKPSKVAAPAKTTCAPSDDSCIPPDHPSSGPIAVPVLKVGQSMPLQLPTSGGAVDFQITLTGLKTKPPSNVDKPGTRELCFGFRLKNTSAAGGSGDNGASLSWKWFGLDGEQADPDAGTAGMCDELGHEFAGLDQPAPLPGKYVTGYYALSVPAKPGALEVTDSDDSPLFRLNYGPRSAQVPIDARGQ